MSIIKLDIIETYLLILMTIGVSFFLLYPDSGAKIDCSAFSTRIFTNIVVGGDVVEPEILTPGPAVPTPIVAPIPSITPVPVPIPTSAPTPAVTNWLTGGTNRPTNTNN